MTVLLGVLGLCAGVLTTLAGQGGGLFLLLLCSLLVGPHAALAEFVKVGGSVAQVVS